MPGGVQGGVAQQWGGGGSFVQAPPASGSGPGPFQQVNTPMPMRSGGLPPARPMAPGAGFQQGGRPFVTPPGRPHNQQDPRRGLTVAGLCLGAGFLVLLLVFFMAQGLHIGNNGPQTSNVQGGNNTQGSTSSQTATPTDDPTATVEVSPTATQTQYPGQQYIFNAKTSRSVNGGQPVDPTTTFKAGQRIYVTFSIHSEKPGAYCLLWFLNSQRVSHYENPVKGAGSTSGYSWAVIQGSGPAYVEVYWASSVACTDKVLAQHVDFTIG
ncbi:MAG: hypothetical protein J2P37_02255 [Ktedonobacteraceae bacterium]|nr:hypothetical protein [Ktedonobacteraceae bacterium]